MTWDKWAALALIIICLAYIAFDALRDRRRKAKAEEAQRQADVADAHRRFEIAEELRAAAQRRWEADRPARDAMVARMELAQHRSRVIAGMQVARETQRQYTPTTPPVAAPAMAPQPTGYEYEARGKYAERGSSDSDALAAAALGFAIGSLMASRPESESCAAPVPASAPFVSGGGGDSAGGGADASWADDSSTTSEGDDRAS